MRQITDKYNSYLSFDPLNNASHNIDDFYYLSSSDRIDITNHIIDDTYIYTSSFGETHNQCNAICTYDITTAMDNLTNSLYVKLF
jgi:hypothetical protein